MAMQVATGSAAAQSPSASIEGSGSSPIASPPPSGGSCPVQQQPTSTREAARTGTAALTTAGLAQLETHGPVCRLSAFDEVPSVGPPFDHIIEAAGIHEFFFQGDAANDLISVDGAPSPPDVDPVGDLLGTWIAHDFPLNRRQAAAIRRQLQPGPTVFHGAPVNGWLRPGRFDLTILDLAGDPTAAPAQTVMWHLLGDPNETPSDNVLAGLPNIQPLQGGQNLLTFARVRDGRASRPSWGLSNFGNSRLGPDGSSRYYNGRSAFVVIVNSEPNRVMFLGPSRMIGNELRPITQVTDTETSFWDFGTTGPGQVPFIPTTGAYDFFFECAELQVFHDQTSVASGAFVDGQQVTPMVGPSGNGLALVSPVFAGMSEPPRLNLTINEGDRMLVYDGLAATVQGDVLRYDYAMTHYGPHVWERGAFVPAEDSTWSDGTPVAAEDLARAWDEAGRLLGTSGLSVDEAAGALNQVRCDAAGS
jgi:hypothetical protein